MVTYRDWRYGHRGKVAHPDASSAQVHANEVNAHNEPRFTCSGATPQRREIRPVHVYLCRWTDDYREGEVGVPHFHVGREPRQDGAQ